MHCRVALPAAVPRASPSGRFQTRAARFQARAAVTKGEEWGAARHAASDARSRAPMAAAATGVRALVAAPPGMVH